MRHIFVVILCFGSIFLAIVQKEKQPDYYDDSTLEQQVITENDLKNYKNDEDFNYTEAVKEESILDKFLRWLRNILRQFWEAIFGVGTASGFLYFIFRIVPYIMLGVLIYLLIRFFLKVNSNNLIGKNQEKGQIVFSEEEQIIKNEDINTLINEAIKQKNYRLAIRYYYLLSLKILSENNKIEWQLQKTNEDYIKEISKDSLSADFKNVTKIYDYVWYGEFGIDQLKFEKLKSTFETVNKSIKN